jgi:hypothetical protein
MSLTTPMKMSLKNRIMVAGTQQQMADCLIHSKDPYPWITTTLKDATLQTVATKFEMTGEES